MINDRKRFAMTLLAVSVAFMSLARSLTAFEFQLNCERILCARLLPVQQNDRES